MEKGRCGGKGDDEREKAHAGEAVAARCPPAEEILCRREEEEEEGAQCTRTEEYDVLQRIATQSTPILSLCIHWCDAFSESRTVWSPARASHRRIRRWHDGPPAATEMGADRRGQTPGPWSCRCRCLLLAAGAARPRPAPGLCSDLSAGRAVSSRALLRPPSSP